MGDILEDFRITKYGDNDDQGEQIPYAFVSYAKADKERVFGEVILPLQRNDGLYVYADKQFDYNNDTWTKQMKRNLKRSKVMIMFVSNAYVKSYACCLEVMTAVKEDIPIVTVYVETPEAGKSANARIMSDTTKSAFKTVGEQLKLKSINSDNPKTAAAYNLYLEIKDMIDDQILEDDLSNAFIDMIKGITTNRARITDSLETLHAKLDTAATGRVNGASVFGYAGSTVENEKVEQPAEKQEKPSAKTGRTGAEEEYSIYGREAKGNQSDMMIEAIRAIIDRHPDKLEEISDCLTSVEMDELAELQDVSYFRIGRECKVGDVVYSIGASYGRDAKLSQIRQAILLTREDPHQFRIEGLYNDRQLKKAEEAFAAEAGKADVSVKDKPVRSDMLAVECYSYYGKNGGGNQSDMMYDMIHAIIEKHPDMLPALSEALTCVAIQPLSELRDIPYFRVGREFAINGITYSIGTSYGRDAKLAQVRAAIRVTREDPNLFAAEGLFTEKQFQKALELYRENEG